MTGWRRFTPLAVLLLAVFSASLLQGMLDPDLFWHIRAGRDMIEQDKISVPDTWNYLFGGKAWVNQQWLVELVYAAIHGAGGLSALFWSKALFCALIGLLIFLSVRERPDDPTALLVTALTVALVARYFLMRTQVFSFLFFAALAFLLEKFPPHKRTVPLAALFALWANVHAFFGLGLMALGLHSATAILVEMYREKSAAPAFRRENLYRGFTVPLCFLATFLNPFGAKIYQTAGSLFSQRQETLVSEWLPVWKYPLTANWMFFAFFALMVFLCVVFSERIELPRLAMAIPLVLFGFYSVRILPFSVVVCAPLLCSLLRGLPSEEKAEGRESGKLMPLALALLLAFSAVSIAYRIKNPVFVPDTSYREDYPVGAVAFMKESGLSGKVFNEFDWGGYVVYAGKDLRTAIDGRTAVLLFPAGYLEEWRDTVDLKPGWKERLERGSPDYVLLYSDDIIVGALAAENSGWQVLYADSISVLFGRMGRQ